MWFNVINPFIILLAIDGLVFVTNACVEVTLPPFNKLLTLPLIVLIVDVLPLISNKLPLL